MGDSRTGHFLKLGDLVEMQKGFAFKSSWYCDYGKPIVKVSNFTNDAIDTTDLTKIPFDIAKKYSKYELKEGDVVIQTVGSWPSNPASVVGKCIKVPHSAHNSQLNQNAVRLRPLAKLDNKFLYYTLRTPKYSSYIVGTAQGAASQAAVTLDSIRAYELYCPHISIQRKISAILSAYDDLIENNLRRIKILEEMAQNLYREWFVNFCFPGHEQTRFVDSPQGRMPEGWETVPVKEILLKNIGGSWGKDEPSEENSCEVRVIRGTDFKKIGSGSFDDVPTRFIKPKELANRLIQPGDLLVENSVNASSRCVGTPRFITSGILKKLKLPSICASFCKLYRPLNSEYASLLYLHMNHLLDKGKMSYYQNVAANGIGNFQSQRFLEDEKIVLPADISKLNLLLEKLSPLLTSNYAERIATLRQTRDLLLPKLISGELDVSDLEITLPEVVEA